MEPVKEFSKTLLTLDNCIIPNDRLFKTPSAKDGMSREIEIDIRIKGCECIQSAGMLLKLPQAAMATAQILFQRFFYAKSIVKFKFYYAAMASLFLAAKIEECNRRLRDVLNVFHHLKQKRKGSKTVPMDYVGEEYFSMRNTVNKYERYILKELGFSVHVQHPHKLVITCLQLLGLEKNSQLVQKAWNLMNDGLRTNIFVRYEVHSIACACILLASRQLKISLPRNPAWWKLFDVRFKDMKAISLEILALYQRKVKSLEELEKEVELLKEIMMSQKKVEIKEIEVKPKSDESPSLSGASPSNQSPTTHQQQPMIVEPSNTNPSKSSESNLLSRKTIVNNLSPVNGYKRDRNSSESSIFTQIEKKPKIELDRLPQRTPEAYRPISSPIKLSSGSSHSESDSITPPPSLSQHNGGSNNYITIDEDSSPRPRKHHRHKHRSSVKHHRHHHHRDRSRERLSDHHTTSKHSSSRHRHREDKDSSRSFSRTVSMPNRSSEYDRRSSSRKADSFYR